MKDKSLKREIKICEAYARKTPKTINEALSFETDDDLIASDEMDDVQTEPEMGHEPEIQQGKMNVEEFVDDIRKKALKGMAELADEPESQSYQILKKIWQICDKKPEDQKVAQEGIR